MFAVPPSVKPVYRKVVRLLCYAIIQLKRKGVKQSTCSLFACLNNDTLVRLPTKDNRSYRIVTLSH